MQFAVIGLNHDTASMAMREKVAFSDAQKIQAISTLMDEGVKELVILSTCGRSEIYCAGSLEKMSEVIEDVKTYFSDYCGDAEVLDHLYCKVGEVAIAHLIQVAVGLDSIVLGEDQILGQIKSAHVLSMEMGASSKILNTLFRDAVASAKKVKTALKISEIPVSISSLGIKALKQQVGSLKKRKVCIVGLGLMGDLAYKYLLEEESELTLCARNREKLQQYQEANPEIKVLPYTERYEALKDHDIIVTATSAPHLVFLSDDFKDLENPIVLLDLSLPRDIEEAVREKANVTLINMDDLQRVSEVQMERRAQLTEEAKILIKEDVEKLNFWLSNVKLDEAIKDLNLMIQTIEKETLTYLHHKLHLDHKENIYIEKALQSALKRAIRQPLLNIKGAASQEDKIRLLNAVALLYGEGEGEGDES